MNFDDFWNNANKNNFTISENNSDAKRQISAPVVNKAKYERYCQAASLLDIFLKDGRGKVRIDNGDVPWSYHCVIIYLRDLTFDTEAIRRFFEILKLFDSMTVMTTPLKNGGSGVSLRLIMEDIYMES